MRLQNYACGEWISGTGAGEQLYNSINGNEVAIASSEGLDFSEMFNHARDVGNPALRKMSFHDRARRLKALALYLTERKKSFYDVSWATGATKIDSWIDIEGGIGNLFAYASKGRRELPDTPFHVDGNPEILSRGGSFIGHHICVPKEGVAVHINAYNFPVWGMLEKIAVNLLAGVPAIVKPATVTSFLTEAVFKEIIKSNILPEGSLQLVCGSARNLLDYVDFQDVVTFTGSFDTGIKLKAHPKILENSVPFNMEADSLNCSVLGPEATPGTDEFNIFIKETVKEMTIKAGQKCTAIRRIIVPDSLVDEVQKELSAKLEKVVVGDPQLEGVRMGALAGKNQQRDVLSKMDLLKNDSEHLYGKSSGELQGADFDKGAFLFPQLFYAKNPLTTESVHSVEAFGPVSTIMGYKDTDEAVRLVKKGKGSLVGSVVTSDDDFASELVLQTASHHGRFVVHNSDCYKESTGHGSPMPALVHGGPGRAGGGEEMGGIRGVFHYMQRTAIQGHPTSLTKITQQYQPGAKQTEDRIHPFRKYFEELEIGETLTTHKRTVTEADIVNFANISGDNFYAHMDETSLEGTLFEKRVAHGYFVMSAAAGLFVDPKKGPVLANYGVDEFRFLKPVYVGATIGVRLSVKQKMQQEKRTEEDILKGIVKWQVDVFDETGESCAIGTILTLVANQDQNKQI